MKKQLEVIMEENEDPSFVAAQDTLAETDYLKQENTVKTGAKRVENEREHTKEATNLDNFGTEDEVVVLEPVEARSSNTGQDRTPPFIVEMSLEKIVGGQDNMKETAESSDKGESLHLESEKGVAIARIGGKIQVRFEGPGYSGQEETKDLDNIEQTTTNTFVNEVVPEPSSLLKRWQEAFTWDDFLYSLFVGFLPTAWDVLSDIMIASQLKEQVDKETAGLSYLFVCAPGITLLFDLVSRNFTKNCSNAVVMLVYYILFICFTAILILCFLYDPLLLKYPSIVLGVGVIGVKGICVFVHTPELKEFSTKVSVLEYSWESSFQLLLLLYTWINGGPLFISAILSSLLIIGKTSTEYYLISEPENLLAEKSFLEKLKLIIKHLPLFSLTAFFRLGSSVIKHSSPHPAPIPVVFFFICVFVMCFVYFVLYSLVFVVLKLFFPILRELSLPEVSQFIISEFTTITPWGRLKYNKNATDSLTN